MSEQPIGVFASAEHDQHATPSWHPERASRVRAALGGIPDAGLIGAARFVEPRLATTDEISRVHDPDYVLSIEQFCREGGGDLDGDTSAAPGSFVTAQRAAGGVLDAIDALDAGTYDVTFAAGRPPGHHAVVGQAMGFCLFNNIAVGAAALVARGQRVAIVDWDVHHGNGTQDIFYDDPNVLFVSMHESPLYPGTGRADETGGPNAPMSNLNMPFPAGTRGDVYRRAVDEVVAPVVERFAPDWLLISAGFDGHHMDPLAGLELTSADFSDIAQRLQQLVGPHRMAIVLEGGYDLDALAMSTGAVLATTIGESYRPEAASAGDVGIPTITAARQRWLD